MEHFTGVGVWFPSGTGAFCDRDDWERVDWKFLSAGEVRVDVDSFTLIFLPQGNGSIRAKPLGCLTGAAAGPGPVVKGAKGSVVVSTSDPVHGLILLSFENWKTEESFRKLAQAAERACAPPPRRSTMPGHRPSTCTGHRSSIGGGGGGPRDAALVDAVAAILRGRCPGAWPLAFGGAELYRADGQNDGSEMLVARGVAALCDFPDAHRVGEYRFYFFEEGCDQPVLELPIGPRMKFTRMSDPAPDVHPAARRLSVGCDAAECQAPVFGISMPGQPLWELMFDSEVDSEGFARDFDVRQRLTALSLKTARIRNDYRQEQNENAQLRRWGIFATLWWLVSWALILLVVGVLFYAGAIYLDDPEKPAIEITITTVKDMSALASLTSTHLSAIGADVCGLFVRSVKAADLEDCVALPAVQARSCAASLVETAASFF